MYLSIYLSMYLSIYLSHTDFSSLINSYYRIEKAKIMIANTPMDTDKIKIYGSRVRTYAAFATFFPPFSSPTCSHLLFFSFDFSLVIQVRVDSMTKVAEIEEAEKQKMRNKYEIHTPIPSGLHHFSQFNSDLVHSTFLLISVFLTYCYVDARRLLDMAFLVS